MTPPPLAPLHRGRPIAAAAGLAALLASAAPALAASAALVQTVQPHRGTTPRLVVAYGAAAPSTLAVRNLTLPQTGQVAAVQVVQGQAVKKGQALLTFTTAPAAVATYRQAQTAVKLAEAQRLHASQLLAQQLGTKDQLAAAEKALADANAQLAALTRDGAGKPSQTLVAPADGIVTATPVAAGDRPAAGAPLVGFSQSSGMQVSVGIEPGYRTLLHAGEAVRLEPLGAGPAIQGRVIRVDGVLNPRSRLVDVDVSAPAGQALSGETFKAQITVGAMQGWFVPHASVQVVNGQSLVFQVAAGKARRVNVDVVQAGRDTDVVNGALDPNLPVVVAGAYQLDDGDAVRTR